MNPQRRKMLGRIRRHRRVRKRVEGTPARPRLAVFRSLKHIYGQIIDDGAGRTLLATSSRTKDVTSALAGKKPIDRARVVGEALGRAALAAGIRAVAFDRAGHRYHGRVAAFADGVRAAGVQV